MGFNPNDAFRSFSDTFVFGDGTICAYALIAKGFDLEGTKENEIIIGTNATDRISGHGRVIIVACGVGSVGLSWPLARAADYAANKRNSKPSLGRKGCMVDAVQQLKQGVHVARVAR